MTFTKLAWISIPLAFWACTDSSTGTTSWTSANTASNEGNYGNLIYERHALADSLINRECKVYATDSKVVYLATTVADFMDPFVIFSEIDISGKMKVRDELHSTDPLYGEALQEQCLAIKQSYSGLINPLVTCSDTAVVASAESNVVRTLDEIKAYVNSSCDNFIQQIEEGSYEKAQSCTVDYVGNVAYLSAIYPNKGASVKATFLEGGSVLWEESYTGISTDLFLQACESHKDKEYISDVLCEGTTLSYRETRMGISFDKLISALKFSCYTLNHGLEPFEEMLFEE